MMAKHPFQNHTAVDALIAHTGIISQQILKFYRYMRISGCDTSLPPHAPRIQRVHRRIRRLLSHFYINTLADFLYTYYLGGSLTRRDQYTFARIHEMEDRAHRLTGINALFFGIPTAALYFLAGEGFQILSRANAFTEWPALLAGNTSLAIGAVSLAVDLFRVLDAFLKKRCWAPFGVLPFVINLPTYMKRAFVAPTARKDHASHRKSGLF
jgi:hypothetical protein